MKRTSCFLCSDLAERGGRIFFSKDFAVTSDLSPLGQGHLLVHTTEHLRSFADLDAGQLEALERSLGHLLKAPFLKDTEPVLFEHGTDGEADIDIGCTDHAHIHILPVAQFATTSAKLLARLKSDSVAEQSSVPLSRLNEWRGQEFFWVADCELQLARVHPIESERQILRRLVADALRLSAFRSWDLLDLAGAKDTMRSLTIASSSSDQRENGSPSPTKC